MDRIYLISGRAEIVRRRPLVGAGRAVEAWEDLYTAGEFWMGPTSRALLEEVGSPLPVKLSVEAAVVQIYYGPRLRDPGSLPLEESLRARVLSGHGVAAAWITLDRLGERRTYEPQSPADPIFYLRRLGGGMAHIWRRFETRRDARAYLQEDYGDDPEALAWADSLPVEDYAEILRRRTSPGP